MAQLTPIRGFTNTPTTKSICIVTTVTTFVLAIIGMQHILRLAIDPFIVEYSQYWRLFTFQFATVNESDYLLVIVLWFYFKNLERFYGLRKYLSVVILFAVFNGLLCLLVMAFGQLAMYSIVYIANMLIFRKPQDFFGYSITLYNEVTSGPLGILSSLYVCYNAFIPPSYKFTIQIANPFVEQKADEVVEAELHGSPSPTPLFSQPNSLLASFSASELTLTDRFPMHLVFAILLLNGGVKSVIPCFVGVIIGKLFADDLLPGRSWLVPGPIFRFFVGPVRFVRYTYRHAQLVLQRRRGYVQVPTPTPESEAEVVREGLEEPLLGIFRSSQ